MPVRPYFLTVLLAGMLALALGAETLLAQQPGTPQPPAAASIPTDVAMLPKEDKPSSKLYIVGYALVVLMTGLGVLVICHYRERKDRPDLPQEMVEERLRQGIKAPGQKGS